MISNRDPKYLKEFGKNLKKLREKHKLSQEALANEAGLGRNQIYQIEKGLVNPTISTVKKLAVAMDIKPFELFKF